MRGAHLLPAARALSLLRILCGAILLIAGWGKMVFVWVLGLIPVPMAGALWQHDFPARLAAWLPGHAGSALAAIVRDLVLPHGTAVAGLLAWLQLIVGALLVIGLYTRLAAVMAMLLAAALTLTAGASGTGARVYLILGVWALALLLGNAGQTFGLDGWRREVKRGNEF